MKIGKASPGGADLRKKLDRAIEEWDERDARGLDPRRPVGVFLDALYAVARRPVESADDLHVLRRAVERMIAEGRGDAGTSVEGAMLTVLGEAIEQAGSPLEAAVFALARHQLAQGVAPGRDGSERRPAP